VIQRDQFEADGYSVLRGVLSMTRLEALIDVLVAALGGARGDDVDRLIVDAEARDHAEVYAAALLLGSSLASHQLLVDSPIPDLAAVLLETEIAYLHTMPLYLNIQLSGEESHDYTWHQERSYYPWCPSILSAWFPLMRSTAASSGTMAVIPGSHRRDERPEAKPRPTSSILQMEVPLLPGELKSLVPIEIDPGDAVVFAGGLVHASLPNAGVVPRMTGILRFVDQRRLISPRPLYKTLSYET
jgi:hypothetical protein